LREREFSSLGRSDEEVGVQKACGSVLGSGETANLEHDEGNQSDGCKAELQRV
jgi:hypothetical protein